jgi:alpha-tubulin suppressor-like RCC1 family protein
MSVLVNKPTQLSATTGSAVVSVDLILLENKVNTLTVHPRWKDKVNWKSVEFIYENAAKQRYKIVFKIDQNKLSFLIDFPANTRDGLFSCVDLNIAGYNSDFLEIDRAQFLSLFGSTNIFDINVIEGYGYVAPPPPVVITYNLYGFGANYSRQLGLPSTGSGYYSTPTNITTTGNFVKISTGDNFSIGITSEGFLYGVGNNSSGQLGLGDNANRTTWTKIGTLSDWSDVSCGPSYTLALKADGTLWVTGNNSSGQLGLGNFTQRNTFIQSSSFFWKSISAGGSHSCGVTTNNKLYSCGSNSNGELGRTGTANIWQQVGLDTNWDSVSCGNLYTIALKDTGTLWSTGWNGNGQLGLGDTATRTVFTQVGVDTDWNYICSKFEHSHAIKTNGYMYGWGNNGNSQLGVGTGGGKYSPERIVDPNVGESYNIIWSKVEHGINHTVALNSAGEIYSCGYNTDLQLGRGSLNIYYGFLGKIGSDTNWVNIACGSIHSFALKDL